MDIGEQYIKDDEFKRQARLHQSKYRTEILKVECDGYGNLLKEEDAIKGLNFYDDFGILDAVHKRYGKRYRKQLYDNLLRSEHIPFNFFVPLGSDLTCIRDVLNDFLQGSIQELTRIEIEYAPPEPGKYLKDRTAFDACIWYLHSDNRTGILGIEVKYTEQAYALKQGSKEANEIKENNSAYRITAECSGVFKNWNDEKLIEDDSRQIWRNHLLGEKMKQVDKIGHFNSVIFYPAGNKHFASVIPKYQQFLTDPSLQIGITYGDFFDSLVKHSNSERYNRWITYLKKRYNIISE